MKRYGSLDSLRGLAALSVFMNHSLDQWPALSGGAWWLYVPPVRVFWGGREAVILFFVLSGFVLALPFCEGRAPSWPRFALKRWARLYPTYLLAILVSALLVPLLIHRVELASPAVLLRSYWSMLNPIGTDLIDTPAWSLVYEARMSLILPALAWMVLRSRRPWRLVGVLSAISAVGTTIYGGEPLNTFVCVPIFCAGIAMARDRERLVTWYRGLSGGRRLGLAALAVALYANPLPFPATHGPWELIVTAGAAMFILIALAEARAQPTLSWRPLVKVGEVSYSLYLTHVLVLIPAVVLLGGALPRLAIVVICWPLALGVAIAVHRWVERPSTTLSRRLGELRSGSDVLHQDEGWEDGASAHRQSAATSETTQLGLVGVTAR